MTSLWDEVAALSRPKRLPCGVGTLLDGLDAKDKEAVQAVLDNKAFQHEAIAKVLAARLNSTVKADTIARHRNRKCSCVAE